MDKKFNIMEAEALFFDFDGVIVDSLDIKTRAFGELFRDHGEDVVQKVMDYHVKNGGVSRYEKFKYYYRNLLHKDITTEIIDGLDKRFSRLVVENVLKAPFIKGITDFLKRLDENGKECFIISATPQEEIRQIAKSKGIDAFFREIVGSPRSKKENLRYLIDKYAVNPNRSVYFGDAQSDLDAAVECGVNFVGINFVGGIKGYRDFEEFTRSSGCPSRK